MRRLVATHGTGEQTTAIEVEGLSSEAYTVSTSAGYLRRAAALPDKIA